MLGLLIVALAVCLHNMAAPAALAAAGDLNPGGRRRAALAFATAQVVLPVLGLLIGRAWLPRLSGLAAAWGGLTLLSAAALWDLFAPAAWVAANLPVADNPDYTGPVADDGAARGLRLWWGVTWPSLDNAVVGAGVGLSGIGAGSGVLALLAAGALALPVAWWGGDLGDWALRLPRIGSYLLLAATAAMAVGVFPR